MKNFLALFGGVAAGLLLLSACSSGTDSSAEASATSSATESKSPEASAAESQEASSEPSVEAGPPVQVTILLDLDRDQTISDLMGKAGEQGWCETGLTTLLNNAGGPGVSLKVSGIETPFSGRLVPSATNGADLPCEVEAVIENVPSGLKRYSAIQVGGKSPSLAAAASVSGDELVANANIMILK